MTNLIEQTAAATVGGTGGLAMIVHGDAGRTALAP
jgi:hypothetical protein